MRFLYSIAVYLAAPLISLLMLWRGLRDRAYWEHFAERYGFGPTLAGSPIWIHAVSVGEVQACAPLVRSLRQRHPAVPIIVTTLTPTGAQRARALFEHGVSVRFVPFDLPGAVRRFFERVRPRIAVILETELWPNLYHECNRRRVPLVLASARISMRSANRYRRLGALFRDALSTTRLVAAQADGDAERFRSLGADPRRVHVTGNVKFDFEIAASLPEQGRELRRQYAAGRPVWIAGSTHDCEEQIVLDAHELVRTSFAQALLILVPRHPPRFDEVAGLLRRRNIAFQRRSSGFVSAVPPQVILVDTLGELAQFYAAADVAFVGGSLVPIGGHNLLEPAALGLPILTGPHNSNSAEIAQLLIASGAARIVHDASELAASLTALLGDPAERNRIGTIGRECVHSNRGALEKLLELIEPVLRG